jgi:hypothetical protein
MVIVSQVCFELEPISYNVTSCRLLKTNKRSAEISKGSVGEKRGTTPAQRGVALAQGI